MHGIGNDYIYINCLAGSPDRLPDLARRMSDRHTGVGGDGIVLICPSDSADFRMRIFNADGSEARMCGNASRCIARYVSEQGLAKSDTITLETLSGIRTLDINRDDAGNIDSVSVAMGMPVLECSAIPVTHSGYSMIEQPVETSRGIVQLTAVSMGNPHGVVFTSELSDAHVLTLGPELENHPMWPDRANIEFVRADSPAELTMRVWERGSGETMACGTGACAAAVAAGLTGRAGSSVKVNLPGGSLHIDVTPGGVIMTGEATRVFDGTYEF